MKAWTVDISLASIEPSAPAINNMPWINKTSSAGAFVGLLPVRRESRPIVDLVKKKW